MNKNPVVFNKESTNGGHLTNIGVCKFFDRTNGKLYTVHIELISSQLKTKYTIINCKKGLCSGSVEFRYCTTCNGVPQDGYLEQNAPAIIQIKTNDLWVYEVCNFKIEEDNTEQVIEFFKEKLDAVDDLFTFMKMHSVFPSMTDAEAYLTGLELGHKRVTEVKLKELRQKISSERSKLVQASIDSMEKGIDTDNQEINNREKEVMKLEAMLIHLENKNKN